LAYPSLLSWLSAGLVLVHGSDSPNGPIVWVGVIGSLTLAAAEDEAPEEIESLDYDLAGPLLEELSLAIDPYPRAPGVTFESPADETRSAEGPFAALKSLKERD